MTTPMNPPPDAPMLPPNTVYAGQLKDHEGIVCGHVWDPTEKEWSEHEEWEGALNNPNEKETEDWHLAVKSERPAAPVAGEDKMKWGGSMDLYMDAIDREHAASTEEPPVTDSQRAAKDYARQMADAAIAAGEIDVNDQEYFRQFAETVAQVTMERELAAALKDKERLEWLLANRFIIETDSHGFLDRYIDTRDEIDAAMREGEGL